MTDEPDTDDFDRIMRVIRARCGDVLSADDLAMLSQLEPLGEMIPVAVADQILDVVMALDDRMAKLEATVAHAGEDVVNQIRRLLIDLTVEDKAIVVDQLHGWVEAERGTHERQH